jgi:hypothetical protein
MTTTDNATPKVRLRRDEREGLGDGVCWIVLVNGEVVGKVEQRSVRQDHKPRGARYVTRSTYSNRWVAVGASRLHHVGRRRAVADLLEKTLGVDCYEAEKLSATARNETEAERAAAQA